MKYQLSMLAINKVLGIFQICGNIRKRSSQCLTLNLNWFQLKCIMSSQNNEYFFPGFPLADL